MEKNSCDNAKYKQAHYEHQIIYKNETLTGTFLFDVCSEMSPIASQTGVKRQNLAEYRPIIPQSRAWVVYWWSTLSGLG